jgi:sugar O-acyltransferase (sialic acid O-acetyltransferase NeuD family)
MSDMRKLLIVGAGGFGREVYAWASDFPKESRDWEITGFLDDNLQALDHYHYDVPIIGTISDYIPKPDECLVLAVGLPPVKRNIIELLNSRGASWITLIHPTVVIGRNVQIGEGCVVCPHAMVTCDITLGNFVTLNAHSTVGHDAVVGDRTTASVHADITGFVQIGEDVFLGSHASILPGAKVGDRAVIGAGSVVLKRVKPGVTVIGVPAKPL